MLFVNFKNMARPCKDRNIEKIPCFKSFKPCSAKEDTPKVELAIDEYEALRLAHLEDFSCIKWAKLMWISSATFNRILKKANKKVVDCLVNWKCIFIDCEELKKLEK